MLRRFLLVLLLVLVAVVIGHRSLRPPDSPTHFAFGRGPDIVIVHGLGSTVEHWLPVARRLARTHRVTFVHLPGHGVAAMPDPLSLERAAAALDHAIAEATDRPVVLVGHSLGGLVAAVEALAHPERVRGLVLVETALKPQVSPADLPAMLEALETNYEGLLRSAYQDMARDSAQADRMYAEVAALDSATIKPWVRLAWMADLSGQMRRLQPRLLAVLAPHSWEPRESWQEAAAALGYEGVPRVTPLRLEGCRHFIMLDRPDALAEAIARFADTPAGESVATR